MSLLDPKNALSVYRGESKTLTLTVTSNQPDPDDPNSVVNGPFDLTDSSIYFTVKQTTESTDVLIRKSTDSVTEIEITNARGGEAKIFLKPEDLDGFRTNITYVFDVWVVLPSGDRHPVIVPSTFRVLSTVTRF